MAENPGAYIVPDPGVVTMLKQYRESGRKTFLVTNRSVTTGHVAWGGAIIITKFGKAGLSSPFILLRQWSLQVEHVYD